MVNLRTFQEIHIYWPPQNSLLTLCLYKKSGTLFNVPCLLDTRERSKEREKIENYYYFNQEFKWIWNCLAVLVLPVSDWCIGYNLERSWEIAENDVCLLGAAKIIRKVLDTKIQILGEEHKVQNTLGYRL